MSKTCSLSCTRLTIHQVNYLIVRGELHRRNRRLDSLGCSVDLCNSNTQIHGFARICPMECTLYVRLSGVHEATGKHRSGDVQNFAMWLKNATLIFNRNGQPSHHWVEKKSNTGQVRSYTIMCLRNESFGRSSRHVGNV